MISRQVLLQNSEITNEAGLKNLFRDVHNLNKLLGQFSRQAVFLREISVNSAIAAGHVGAESGALSEIAKQIGTLSLFLTESVADAHETTGQMSNSVLTCIVEASKREKILSALDLVGTSSEENQIIIRNVSEAIGNHILEQLRIAKSKVQNLSPMIARLNQVIHRTWSIVMSLRISSGMSDDEEGSFFLSISESLEKMAEECTGYSREITDLTLQVERTLERACNYRIGGEDAA